MFKYNTSILGILEEIKIYCHLIIECSGYGWATPEFIPSKFTPETGNCSNLCWGVGLIHLACCCPNPAVLLLHPTSNLCPALLCAKIPACSESSGSLHHAPLHSWKDASHLSHVIIRSYTVPLGLSEIKKANFFIPSRHLSPANQSTGSLNHLGSLWISC